MNGYKVNVNQSFHLRKFNWSVNIYCGKWIRRKKKELIELDIDYVLFCH